MHRLAREEQISRHQSLGCRQTEFEVGYGKMGKAGAYLIDDVRRVFADMLDDGFGAGSVGPKKVSVFCRIVAWTVRAAHHLESLPALEQNPVPRPVAALRHSAKGIGGRLPGPCALGLSVVEVIAQLRIDVIGRAVARDRFHRDGCRVRLPGSVADREGDRVLSRIFENVRRVETVKNRGAIPKIPLVIHDFLAW